MSGSRDGQSSAKGGGGSGGGTPQRGDSTKMTMWSRSPNESVTFDRFMESKIRQPDPTLRVRQSPTNADPSHAGQYNFFPAHNNPYATADQRNTTPTGRTSGRRPPNSAGSTVHFGRPFDAAATPSGTSSGTSSVGVGGTRRSVTTKMRTPAIENDMPSGRYIPKGQSPPRPTSSETAKYHVDATTHVYVGEAGGSGVGVGQQRQNRGSASKKAQEGASPNLSIIQRFDRDVIAELRHNHAQEPTARGLQALNESLKKKSERAGGSPHEGDSPPEVDISTTLKSTLSGSEIERALRQRPDSELAAAIDMYLRAEAAQLYAGAVRAAEEAAANAPPGLAEEAAAAGARGYRAKVTDTVYETMKEMTESGFRPIEVIGYIGLTKPTT